VIIGKAASDTVDCMYSSQRILCLLDEDEDEVKEEEEEEEAEEEEEEEEEVLGGKTNE
jgi:hypothetical protein